MKKLFSVLMLTLMAVAFFAPAAFAEEAAAATNSAVAPMAVIGAGLAIGLAGLGAGIGMGFGLRGATEGVARNPGASGKVTTTLIIGLAMIESLAIYALLIALAILINQKVFF